MSKEWTPETVLDLIGDAVARDILEHASDRPASAETLADRTGVSLPTIYRRINALQQYGLLDEGVHVDDDGNHFKRFATTLSDLHVTLDDGTLTVDVERDTDLTDRFSEFWHDLETGAAPGDGLLDADPGDASHRDPNAN